MRKDKITYGHNLQLRYFEAGFFFNTGSASADGRLAGLSSESVA
jgi:hypothetical protein